MSELPRWTCFAFVALLVAAGPGCKRADPQPVQGAAPVVAPAAVTPASQPSQLIEDDYARALAEARSRKLPLFVEVWASWCHTCNSMRQYVLPDPVLASLAGSFVWAGIDSERADNAAFLKRFPTRNLPTLWVIDSATEQPLLKWIGAATAQELSLLLSQARENPQPTAAESGAAAATAEWVRGNRASATGDAAQAIERYRAALQAAPADWSLRARAVETLSMRYIETAAQREAFELARQHAASLPASTARLNVVLNGIDSGAELAQEGPAPEGLSELLALGTRIAEDPAEPVLLDDRSSLYLSLVHAQSKAQPAESKRLAARWSALLDAEAAKAQLPAARRVWDPHRLEAYMALGETQKAVPMLEQSEREVPDDYNPPARLARALLTLGQLEPARAASERALARCEGPRKLRLYMLKSDILLAQSERAGAADALRDALRYADERQLAPQYDKLRQSIERKIAAL